MIFRLFGSPLITSTFTPRFSNSIIWLIVTIAGEHYNYSDLGIRYNINQDSTVLYDSQYTDYHSSDNSQNISQHSMQWYGSAGSTSARSYSVSFRPSNSNGSAVLYIQIPDKN